jgi:hypothetical protein
MFETELNYFIKNQSRLIKRYHGRVIALMGESVVGDFDSPVQAFKEMAANHKIGTFMIQPCEKGPGAYSVNIKSIYLSPSKTNEPRSE